MAVLVLSQYVEKRYATRLLAATTHTGPLSRLTERERSVLDLMAQGHTNASIGTQLFVSRSAVEKHVNSIFAKLDLPERSTHSRRILAILHYLDT